MKVDKKKLKEMIKQGKSYMMQLCPLVVVHLPLEEKLKRLV